MNGALMAREIGDQPQVFARILREGLFCIDGVCRAIARRQPRFVLFAARGTSDHAALYGKYLVETQLKIPAGLVSPSTMTIYDTHPTLHDVLFIAISQSGASPDLIEPVIRARAGGAITLAITNTPDSLLAVGAEYQLNILAGKECAVAATKTYTAELLVIFLLIQALSGQPREDIDWLPEQAEAVLAGEAKVAQLALRYRFAEQIIVTARGYNYPTARETALKLMETSYLVAHGISAADLLHGPVAMIGRGFPVIAIVPEGAGGRAMDPLLDRLRDLGADTMIVGDPTVCQRGIVALALGGIPEILSPLLLVLPMQQFAWHLARARGNDPDQPAGIEKVTETW